MIRNIYLDLDNTLLDFKRGEIKAIQSTLTQMGISPTEKIIDRYIHIGINNENIFRHSGLFSD